MEKIKIDLVSVPFRGHFLPALTLIYPLLKDDRYKIRVITDISEKEFVENLGFTYIPLFAKEKGILQDISNHYTNTNIWSMIQQFQLVTQVLYQGIKDLEKIWNQERPDIVLADFVTVAVPVLCYRMHIPWITCIPSPCVIESRNSAPAYFGGLGPGRNRIHQYRNFLARKLVRIFKITLFTLFKKNLREYADFKIYNKEGYERIYSPYSIIGLGLEELEFRKDFPPQFIWAGYHCMSFEDTDFIPNLMEYKQKKVLLTCGTHLISQKQELQEIAKNLAVYFPDFLFIITNGDVKRKLEKVQQLSDNILMYPYLPYEMVLPNIDYCIHHGGAGILYHCIAFGIPALIIPRDYDQFDYTVRAKMMGIARVCKRGDNQGLIREFQKLIQKKQWNRLKYLQKKYREYQGTEILKNEIQRILQKDKEKCK